MDTTSPDDEPMELVLERAQGGDEDALDRLLRRAHPRVFRWALAHTGAPDDADEVAQDALVRIYRGLSGFRRQSRLTTWLYRVTRSAATDWHRRRASRAAALERLTLAGDTATAAPAADPTLLDDARLAGLVRTFFQELPGRQREVFDLCDLQGHAPTEVAELLDMNPVTVRAHLFKARRTIRRRILESHPELVEDRA